MSKEFLKSYIPKVTKWAEVYAWVKNIPESDLPLIVQGRIGELLVSYYLFGENKLNWDIQNPGDDAHCDLIYEGKKIDVKTCRFFKDAELKEFYTNRIPEPDKYYCLVSLNLTRHQYKIQGFIEANTFLSDQYIVKNWRGKGKRFVCNANQLNFECIAA